MSLICRPGDPGYIVPGSPEYCEVIGCSSVGDIMGWGYRKTANDVWLSMTHRKPDQEHKRIFDRGHDMEPIMARRVQEEHGRILKGEQVQYRDPDRPWLIFHADGMFPKHSPLLGDTKKRDGPGVWEAKAPGSIMAKMMIDEGMTKSYVCQGQIGMHVAGMALGMPITWGTFGFLDYDGYELVAFDMDAIWSFQKKVLAALDEFYDCVQRDVPPTPINPLTFERPPIVNGKLRIVEDGELLSLSNDLRALAPAISSAEAKKKMIRERIKEILFKDGKAEVPGVMRYSYQYGKAKENIDGEGLLEYCEHLVGEHNHISDLLKMTQEDPLVHKLPHIAFDRTHWVEPVAPKRTLRTTVIKE